MVKRLGWLIMVLLLALPALAGCDLEPNGDAASFDALARRVPGSAEQVLFLDFKPGGDVGRYWRSIRRQIAANSETQQILDGMLNEFRVSAYGLDASVVGPAVNGLLSGSRFVIVPVSDGGAVEETLREQLVNASWQEEEFEGLTLHSGRNPEAYSGNEHLAWVVRDDVLYLTSVYNGDPVPPLQSLLTLAEGDSLAANPAWKTARDRLLPSPLGIVFLNIAEQMRRYPPAPGDRSLGTLLGQQVEAVALAALPDRDGMRVDVEGVWRAEGEMPLELLSLFSMPPVDPNAWTALPADTAMALISRDASTVWPWLVDLLSLSTGAFDEVPEAVGLDIEADLFGVQGPLTGRFALGVTPPLPDQPISQGLTAGQLLALARGATEAQAEGMRAAMESRGALFRTTEVEGLSLQTQVGTELSGYAVSYGAGDEFLYVGSSPTIVGRGIAARRDGRGMVDTAAFQSVAKALLDDPILVFYVHNESMLDLQRANTTSEQTGGDLVFLEPFEAIGLDLRLDQERLQGVIYFLMKE
jgi:hypothetical protein